MKRWLALGATVLLGGWLVHSCRATDDELPAPRAVPGAPSDAAPRTAPPVGATASPTNAASAQALADAADVVQNYLQAAAAARWDEADAFWRDGRAPDAHAEGGLRDVLPAAALRIASEAPEPLDDAMPPARVRVPVELRLTGNDDCFHRYTGHYLLHRDPVTRACSIADASMHAVLGGR